MIPLVGVVTALLLSVPETPENSGTGPRRWTWWNTATAAAWTGLLGVDRATSIEGVRRGMREQNPILGHRPRESQVNAYTAAAWAGGMAIGALLPTGWRTVWYGGLVLLEGVCVVHQLRMGLGLRF